MKKKNIKIAVVGDFADGMKVYSGQTAKVRDYYYYICKRYGEKNVIAVDTRYWKKELLAVGFKLLRACCICDSFVLLLCTNGIRTVLPFVMVLRKIFGYKVFFPVVGGSLIDEFDDDKYLKKHFEEINAVYFETRMLLRHFETMGYKNIYYAPVFSKRKTLKEEQMPSEYSEPFLLCTYSRVCKEKGISEAIDAVIEINRRAGRIVCTLDVYGPPTEEYKEEFEQKIREAADCVVNRPLLGDSDAIESLANHYLMIFPTYYEGEGFPIATIECMKAGLPVVATDWHFNSEIVENGKTGIVYKREEEDGLVNSISYLLAHPEEVLKMKRNCLKKADTFNPENILNHLFEQIDS